MPKHPPIKPEQIRELLDYDSRTGKLFWKTRTAIWFRSERVAAFWNRRFAGKEAFTAINQDYPCGQIRSRLFRAHRVIWAWVHGCWPIKAIDHINGNRSDNRIENLREAEDRENSRNMARSKRNKSGIVGVNFDRQTGKWRARIKAMNGTEISLGRHSSKEEAIKARKTAEAIYGYHPNHGREKCHPHHRN